MASMKNVGLDENSLRRYFSEMSPEQCRAARAWLGLSQDALAKAASVGVSTVRDFEGGNRVPTRNNLTAMQAVLELSGAVFSDDWRASGISFVKNNPEAESQEAP